MFNNKNNKWVPETEIVRWQITTEIFIQKLAKSLEKQRKFENEPSAPPHHFQVIEEQKEEIKEIKEKKRPLGSLKLTGIGKCKLL